jgi:6-pyruvoyltetrahydropterin/6-carboxytetrahydropterin synthase
MILRHDDPLVPPLQQLGEPIYLLDSNPTVERIARLIFEQARQQGLPVVRVTVWETPTSFATFADAQAS